MVFNITGTIYNVNRKYILNEFKAEGPIRYGGGFRIKNRLI